MKQNITKSRCPSSPVIDGSNQTFVAQVEPQESPINHHSFDSEDADTNGPIVNPVKKVKKKRGPTLCKTIWTGSKRRRVRLNKTGQPIGKRANAIKSFIGTIARNGRLFPLTFKDWRALPEIAKEDAWKEVMEKFDIAEAGKIWFRKSLAKKWKDWKAKLKKLHYSEKSSFEEIILDRDPRVSEDQWRALVLFWMSDEGKKRSKRNKKSRALQVINHTGGTKSFAQIRENLRISRPEKREPSRAEMFVITHKKKNGDAVDKDTAIIISQLEKRMSEQPEGLIDPIAKDDIFAQVMGPDNGGYVRTCGLGPSPSDLWGPLPSRNEALKMAADIKRVANEEIKKMQIELEDIMETSKRQQAQFDSLVSFMKSTLSGDNLQAFLTSQQVHDSSHDNDMVLNQHKEFSSSNYDSRSMEDVERPLRSLKKGKNVLEENKESINAPLVIKTKKGLEKRKQASVDLNANKEVTSMPLILKKTGSKRIQLEMEASIGKDSNNQNICEKRKYGIEALGDGRMNSATKRLFKANMEKNVNGASALKEVISTPLALKNKSSNVANTYPYKDLDMLKKGNHQEKNQVYLLSMTKPYKAVARGNVISTSPKTKVGGIELDKMFWEIYIDVPIIPDEILPRPYEQFNKIGDCVGSTVAWPKFMTKSCNEV